MAAIDYANIPETTRQGLLTATYRMTQQIFKDPNIRAEYEEWLKNRKERYESNKKTAL